MRSYILIAICSIVASVSAAPWSPVPHPPVHNHVTITTTVTNQQAKCGNNQSTYCCNDQHTCSAYVFSANSASCQSGVTVCCAQNATEENLQVCFGQLIAAGDIIITIG